MSDEPVRTTDMVDITDCFEAVNVFRIGRNLFFFAALLCLILNQAAFWTVEIGWVKQDPAPNNPSQAGTVASDVTGSRDAATGALPQQTKAAGSRIRFSHLARVIQVANAVLLLAALLYWLTQTFTLVISLVGRLGGINHICRAFFLSLVVLVLVIPWQYLGESLLCGAVFTSQELAHALATKAPGLLGKTAYYLRFSGYGLAVLALLIMAQMRSTRWAKAILRRLEII